MTQPDAADLTEPAPLRILHAPKNIANQPAYLVKGLRNLGQTAEVWEYDPSPFGFPVDRTISLEGAPESVFWDVFRDAIDRFDVFHFHFGRSLFAGHRGGAVPFWDLPIYRLLGKRVFFTWHGTDCRIRRIHLETNPWSYYRTSDVPADDERTEKTIEIVRTYADGSFVVSPDYLDFVPDAEVLPRVVDMGEWPEQAPEQREVPVVLHVPSRRGTKGTDTILQAVERLKSQGLDFEFRLVEGVSHDEARQAILAADIVVDNVVTGDYEVVSVEAMAASRVAVANLGPRSREAFPDAPVHGVDPPTFAERLRDLIGDVGLRRELASRGRPYVARVHDAPVLAARLLQRYREAPAAAPARTFPDWVSLAPARRIEQLERRNAQLDVQLARAQGQRDELRKRLGLAPLGDAVPMTAVDVAKGFLPGPVRIGLRRLRARLRG